MKRSRKDVTRKVTEIPQLRFEDQRLTSFAGLVVFIKLFQVLKLKKRLARCLEHRSAGKAFAPARLFLQLIVHLLLGFRELRHADYYRDDPLVQRILGFDVMPDVATLSRMLKGVDQKSVDNLKKLLSEMVLERLTKNQLRRITLDFDGSVLSTTRKAQGTAVKKKKRRRELVVTIRCSARSRRPVRC